MHHVVLLDVLRGVVRRAVEDQITGLHLFEGEVDRQCVVLVGLVSSSKHKTKLVAQVVHGSSHQGTAVEKEG